MEGNIVFEGTTKNGAIYIIRYPQSDDAFKMMEYINTLSKEQTFIRFQGEQQTLEEEQKYLDEQLEKIKRHQAVLLLIVVDGKSIGISGIEMKDRVEKHEGVLGISLAKKFRGQGLGKILMTKILEEAEKHLTELRIVTLSVYACNDLAFSMYKKFGFIEYGKLPKGILHKDVYVDHIHMYRNVRNLH